MLKRKIRTRLCISHVRPPLEWDANFVIKTVRASHNQYQSKVTKQLHHQRLLWISTAATMKNKTNTKHTKRFWRISWKHFWTHNSFCSKTGMQSMPQTQVNVLETIVVAVSDANNKFALNGSMISFWNLLLIHRWFSKNIHRGMHDQTMNKSISL